MTSLLVIKQFLSKSQNSEPIIEKFWWISIEISMEFQELKSVQWNSLDECHRERPSFLQQHRNPSMRLPQAIQTLSPPKRYRNFSEKSRKIPGTFSHLFHHLPHLTPDFSPPQVESLKVSKCTGPQSLDFTIDIPADSTPPGDYVATVLILDQSNAKVTCVIAHLALD